MLATAMLVRALLFVRAMREQPMGSRANVEGNSGGAGRFRAETLDLGVLPQKLLVQCRGLIESYHDIHGYACLPNMLWRAELEGFIKKNMCLRQILRKASTTRSAKVSNKGFVEIATAILSLEILASDFANWSRMFPEAKSMANALLRMRSARMFLMEYYLYPPKHISPAILAALAPPSSQSQGEYGWQALSNPELASQRLALNYAKTLRDELKRESALVLPASGWG